MKPDVVTSCVLNRSFYWNILKTHNIDAGLVVVEVVILFEAGHNWSMSHDLFLDTSYSRRDFVEETA